MKLLIAAGSHARMAAGAEARTVQWSRIVLLPFLYVLSTSYGVEWFGGLSSHTRFELIWMPCLFNTLGYEIIIARKNGCWSRGQNGSMVKDCPFAVFVRTEYRVVFSGIKVHTAYFVWCRVIWGAFKPHKIWAYLDALVVIRNSVNLAFSSVARGT
jgi:hypothetical protein